MRADQGLPVPPDVDRLMRDVAGAAPGYLADLDAVKRHGRLRRHRRTGMATVAVVLTAAVAVGLPVLLVRHGGRPDALGVSASPGVHPASTTPAAPVPETEPQRLFLNDPGFEGWAVIPLCAVTEVVNRQLRQHPLPPAMRTPQCAPVTTNANGTQSITIWGSSAHGTAMPSGGLVVSVNADSLQAPPPGSIGTGSDVLIVERADGTVAGEVHLAVGERFLGADRGNLYTMKGNQVLRYTFPGTGRAEPLFIVSGLSDRGVLGGDIAAGRMALAIGDCRLLVLDSGNGSTVTDLPLSTIGCTAGTIRLSPDGLRLAVQYMRGKVPRLAVFELATGRVVTDVVVPQTGLKVGGFIDQSVALAWLGRQVQMAWVQLAASAKPAHYYPLAQALRTYSLEVPGTG